ncbi:type II secretion system protein J [Methylopila henanensis]|uniref:Type II secretion system protein J n=1 Tax=Methylopila henanensis TaxID=873516 RepID=A0ABW4KB89_9HYPH
MRGRGVSGRRDRDGGFLLVEALATLAISAVVIAGLLTLGGLMARAVDRAALRAEGAETSTRPLSVVAREIEGLARRRFAGPDGRFVFLGAPDRLAFAVAPRQDDGLRAPVAVAYQAAGPGQLLRAEAPLLVGARSLDDVVFGEPVRIDLGGLDARFAYVERRPDGTTVVTDQWSEAASLPVAVRIELIEPEGGVARASRTARLIAQSEPGCAAPGKAPCSSAPKATGRPDGQPQVREGER